MKLNKVLIVLFFIAATVSSGVIYSSCTKSKCGGTTCQNGGTCASDKCVCATGYSGVSCEKGWSDQFTGTYTCKRGACGIADTSNWQSVISKASANGGYLVNISNFNRSNITETATVDSMGNLTINPATGGAGLHATGVYSGGVISLTFTTYTTGGSSYTCTMTMTKQ